MPRPVKLVTRFVVPQSEMPPLETTEDQEETASERAERECDRLEESLDLKKFRDDTLVYRAVAERMRYFPIFLYRTVEYLKNRSVRTRKIPKHFDFNKFFEERPRVRPKEQKFLTITYLGFYTNSPLAKNPTVRMETLISKKRGGRKRMKNKSNVRVSAGVCEVYINPSPNDPRAVPIISIPPDMLNLDSYSPMVAKSLVIRAVLDGSENSFECEQILVNDNGKCPVEAGDYEMTSTTKCPNIWVKSLGFPGDFMNSPLTLPRLCFRLDWTQDARSGWVQRPQPHFAKNKPSKDPKGENKENRLSTRRSAGLQNHNYPLETPNEKPDKKLVEYSFHTNNMLVHSFLQANSFLCPWCDLNCMTFYGIFKHLKVTHERFLFNFTKTNEKLVVDIKVSDKADINFGGDPTREFFRKEGGPRRISPFLEVLVWKPRRVLPPNIDRILERQAFPELVSMQQMFGHNRMYYHSSTCLPIHPTEMGEDSENERDPKWLRQKTAMMIDDFTDVNEGEKEVIKLWNLHVLKEGYVGDCQRPKANKDFYAKNAQKLLEKNLYRNGFLHLINQNHFNLLGPGHAYRILRPVLERLKSNQTDADRFRLNYLKERAGWIASGGEGGSRDKAKEEFQTQSGPSTSSTFVTGEGTLRRKMTQSANPKPTNNGKQKVVQRTVKKYHQLCKNQFQTRNDPAEKDRPSRKRKFSFEDCTSGNPARRLRCGSDPVESRNKKKPVMRKTAH